MAEAQMGDELEAMNIAMPAVQDAIGSAAAELVAAYQQSGLGGLSGAGENY